ncbi:hypothetical protein AM587_10006915 [Phytophthora nicotianae]|uniref:Uncharacterized protein n=1 Tax=Phytophthora nicotianae TaxID=4792 RepID=A0A0W8BRT0_PHYNI|nr:hypothetical protein AM587_10006915 [Phytophthora nicotianae]
MAKRKFVSSKKNAPSRAISSKEAALHRRTADGDGAESDSGDSAASSDVGSSTPLSSEDEQEEDDDELNASQDVTPMAVEVMPASVGRGKQLRFPTAISRGKVLPMEGGAASDADDSDDESLLSVADSEDEDGVTAMEVDEPAVSTSPVHIEASPATQDLKINSKDTPFYPIKAARARKRHRPDSDYYKQMSTYVRDCLLSVRHAGSSDTPADAFKDESSPRHEEFRRRLAAGDVERVTWKEPPSVDSNMGESQPTKLRNESAKLMEEARKLKHEGNRRGSSERGTQGQITQGKYYLRSGAKFFEYALKLQEVKVAYQEKNDTQHAHSFGENCVTTLSQTTSLIESTIRAFHSAGSMRLAALGCKMASVVHLTVYRLQHRKLQSFYSELFTPGRSPESRENGLTPPIDPNSNLNSNSSKDAAIRKHLLKEMEHTLRGFEMWRRYEACKVNVLPRVTNPVILDPAVFFEDLEAELKD